MQFVVNPDAPPVLLVHGWGGSYESTWRNSGLVDLLADAGRRTIGVDLLGHGSAPKPHDPDAYSELTGRLFEAIADEETVDAIGFSLGALTVLEAAVARPERFSRLVLAGVGRNAVEEQDAESRAKLLAALDGSDPDPDNLARLFVQYAEQPGNDREALTCVMRRGRRPFGPTELATITARCLVVIGDRDFAGPGDPLVELLPDARLVTLRNVDHFATTENFGFFDATLEFLDALPG